MARKYLGFGSGIAFRKKSESEFPFSKMSGSGLECVHWEKGNLERALRTKDWIQKQGKEEGRYKDREREGPTTVGHCLK